MLSQAEREKSVDGERLLRKLPSGNLLLEGATGSRGRNGVREHVE